MSGHRSAGASAASPPHAPVGGLLRRLLGPFYVTGVFWYRFHRWGVQVLPSWAVGFVLTLFTCFFYLALRRIRRAIASNLEAVLGAAPWWRRETRIFRTLWSFAWCLTERYERLTTDRPTRESAEGIEVWEAAQRSPRGFVVVTAHVGHWEVGTLLPASAGERHVHLVREEEMDRRAQDFLRRLITERAGEGLTVHFAREHDPGRGPMLLAALRRGEVVALQADRPRAAGRTVEASLFGRPYRLPAGPAALARAAGVELIPVFIFREGRRRSRVVFRPPIRVARTACRSEDLRRAAKALAGSIEWAIRERPFQWFCFRALWPEAR